MHRATFAPAVRAGVLALIATLALAPAVLAAPPTNDTYGGRIVIDSLPYANSQATSEATTDADDTELNASCGAPATDASVWYEYTALADGYLFVDTTGSDYTAGLIIGTGAPGTFETWACGPRGGFFPVFADVTYAILVIDDQSDEVGNGGALEFTLEEFIPPPPPTLALSVDSTASFNRDGSATVRGTATCENADWAEVNVSLSQRVGRYTIAGWGWTEVPCDGSTHDWSVRVYADNGLFKGGKAASASVIFACGYDCGFEFVDQIVQLRK